MKSLMAEALERLKSDYDNNSTNTGGDNSSSGLELKLSSLIVINEYCATVFDKMNEN